MLYYSVGGEDTDISAEELQEHIKKILETLGKREKVMIVPPDFTRYQSQAGIITSYVYEEYKDKVKDIMPALGTHKPMPEAQLVKMFPGIPLELFREHDWRNDVVTIGEISAEFVSKVTEGIVEEAYPAQLNKMVWEGDYDLILSIGQVVPHEVIGMANYSKNLLVGTGGKEAIDGSHFIGAAFGMERIMGTVDSPVRLVLNEAYDKFIKPKRPVVYILTVVGQKEGGGTALRGIYVGDDVECFTKASDLALRVNFTLLEKELDTVVVTLDPEKFHTTWLGNKAIYRTRMAIRDGGTLIVLAKGVSGFGEDDKIDALIRKHGYRPTPVIMEKIKSDKDLAANLSAAAHLIHGTSEGRFRVVYCPGEDGLTKEEIESVGYEYANYAEMVEKYAPQGKEGYAKAPNGQEVYYVSNPALGLWAYEGRFTK
mmetsp:Transcript_37013/g.95969  ORF Transcript_37013/g.95969 Transcript_37013/m.95969 type:complete len:427 (-) Transcript_37013:244-1524(-)